MCHPLSTRITHCATDHASRETGRRRGGEEGPIFHVRGLCVATIYT